ncbi:hypothetical protein G4G28_13940 [Massilia sp. Dwa41.01b]|uniref:5-methylcytosine restriction system specificity protein McrC n=1 Tax=unclassified Massilia TaxID=2609279 RepID=UPI00160208A7|nr:MULTISPECIES: hypothetical protein [unclassified Massilia]QNA89290.1 hypothetical protein G4G28_13940 [Massilia sp. Dwa41.01b]QNB00193.1 hypothetical protein G4G31_17520 [Massilia sp. Se16.2.3]
MIRVEDNCQRRALSEAADGAAALKACKAAPAGLTVTLEAYLAAGNGLFSFGGKDAAESRRKRDEELVVALGASADAEATIQTGNYVGRFSFGKVAFDIGSRFGDAFMQRMLNFANDIFIDDGFSPGARIEAGTMDYARALLYMMFVQALEKAFLLGLPKAYRSVARHDPVVRGRIDVARLVRDDIPFLGKVSTVAREQQASVAIVDVLAKAISVIDRNGGKRMLGRIAHVRADLAGRRSGRPVTRATVAAAQSDKSLGNPIFAPYRRVLELAAMIVRLDAARQHPTGSSSAPGFLLNVAELFEIYVRKLLARSFPAWRVSSPAIFLHAGRFYERNIIPDIVMEHEDGVRVAVFDTKYKRMHFQGRGRHGAGDVDREDYFQISTYMSHYRLHPGKRLVAGGLLYPLGAAPAQPLCHDSWMADAEIAFVVDGIVVPPRQDGEDFPDAVAAERAFVERIAALLEPGR